jgi:NDP-sugar pyrophosphorylase family protein
VKALLLAAGLGTRLAPLTDSMPKILVTIAGRPLIEHQLEYLAANGVDSVAVNVSHFADDVVAFLEQSRPPLPVMVSRERAPLGTSGALLPLRDFFAEPFLVLYGDVVTDTSLQALMAEHAHHGGLATLAWYASEETEGKGLLELGEDDRIVAFVEKPAVSGPGRVNAGVYAVDPAVVDLLPPGYSDFGYDVWPAALASGRPIYAHRVDGYVRDIGSPQQLRAVEGEIEAGSISW